MKIYIFWAALLYASMSLCMNEEIGQTDDAVQQVAPAAPLTTEQRREILKEKTASFAAHQEKLKSDKVIVEGLQNITAAKKEKALAFINESLALSGVMARKIENVNRQTYLVDRDNKELRTVKIRIGEGEWEDYHIDEEEKLKMAQRRENLVASFSNLEDILPKADKRVKNILGAVKQMIEHYQEPAEERKDWNG